MRFEFATATRIVFGGGSVKEAAPAAAAAGRRALVVTGRTPGRAAGLLDQLAAAGLEATVFSAAGEPSVETVRAALALAREAGCQVVLGIGGGSALDAGKAIAALLANPGDPLDFLEVVGRGQLLAQPSVPCIAIPTTAGTGSEVTRNAVLTSAEHRAKASLRSPGMYPRLALIDPELTHGLPPALTAATGLDALTQLIEPFVSVAATPFTDMLCREGIRRVASSLRRAVRSPDAAAREDMAFASLLSGLALANARLGAVHGCAAVLGGVLQAPHGVLCARLLPPMMEANVRALERRAPGAPTLAKYAEIGCLLTGHDTGMAAAITWAHAACQDLAIPRLSACGLTSDMIPAVVAEAQRASSTKGNPIALTDEELAAALGEAL
jgi:alcohol dehydrogenase class IV